MDPSPEEENRERMGEGPWLWKTFSKPNFRFLIFCLGFPMALVVKNLPVKAGDIRDAGLMAGSGRSLGGMHGNPLQYSSLENPMDRGYWWTTVQRVEKSRMYWSDLAHMWFSVQTTKNICKIQLLSMNDLVRSKVSPSVSVVKNWPTNRRHSFNPWIGKITWRGKWQPTPIFLSGKCHGQRNLAGCSPGGCKVVGHNLANKQEQNDHYR